MQAFSLPRKQGADACRLRKSRKEKEEMKCRGYYHYEKRKNYVCGKNCDLTFSCIHFAKDGSEQVAEECLKEYHKHYMFEY